MAITDYIPNIFGSTPEAYRGLLTSEQSTGLEKRANLAGLLGFAGALAQGMSPQGYRRSALQNILSAAGAGFGGAAQTYDSGLNQLANVQKLQQSQAQITAINNLLQRPEIANDPMMVAYIRANPGEAIKYFAEMAPLQRAISGEVPAAPALSSISPAAAMAAPSVSVPTSAAPSGVSSAAPDSTFRGITAGQQRRDIGFTLDKEGQLESMVGGLTSGLAPSRMGLTGGGVGLTGSGDMLPTVSAPEVAPETTVLPGVTVQGQKSPTLDFENQKTELMGRINQLRGVNQRISGLPTNKATDIRAANNAEITNLQNQVKLLDDQINKISVAGYDFESVIGSVPEAYQGRVKALQKAVENGTVTSEQLATRLDAILNDASQFAMKQVDFTQENNALFGSMFKNPDGTPRKLGSATGDELAKLLAEKQKREKELRIAGRSQINVGDKVLAGERAKSQARAEENAINAQSAASDVKAIIEVLRPYRGGAWQDFAGQVGAYLPGTKVEQLATARQTAEAIRAKLAPTLRVEGSGATSDFEIKSFLSAIPSLFNTREGRETLATYSQRLADRAAAAADIRAELVDSGTFSIANFQKALKERGLDRVFTPEDIKVLRGGSVPTEGGTNLTPEGQRAFEKYRPR
jgi:hypothetical protein